MEEISKTPTGRISISRDKNKVPYQNGLSFTKKKKRSTAMEVIKAVLSMLCQKSSKSKTILPNLVSRFSWKGVLGSMRQMHLQTIQSSTPPNEAKPKIMTEPMPVGELTEEEAITSPLSPVVNSPAFFISSYGSASDMSQYERSPNLMVNILTRSSAFSMSSYSAASDMGQCESPNNLNLQEIHVIKPWDEITGEEWYDDYSGDEMIDAKAEEFIAHFYEQMRLQNLNL
ncbi:hypothetical protein DITRI_Ditri13aG0072800 [Diplodiscus trichospermus]